MFLQALHLGNTRPFKKVHAYVISKPDASESQNLVGISSSFLFM